MSRILLAFSLSASSDELFAGKKNPPDLVPGGFGKSL